MYPCCSPFLLFMILFVFPQSSDSQGDEYYRACSAPKRFECGNFADNISFPFQVEDGRPDYCGHPGYKITCENDSPEIQIGSKTYRVIGRIDYANRLITVVEKRFAENGYCPVPSEDDSLPQAPDDLFHLPYPAFNITLIYCSEAITNDALKGIPCLQNEGNQTYYYTTPPPSSLFPDGNKKCEVRVLPISSSAYLQWETNTFNITEAVEEGFQMSWLAGIGWCQSCRATAGLCGSHPSDPTPPACFCPDESPYSECVRAPPSAPPSGSKARIAVRNIIGFAAGVAGLGFLLAVSIFMVKKRIFHKRLFFWRNSPSIWRNVETFLENYGSLSPKRYTYSDIKRITSSFKNKLGQGGFGGVYKGELADGSLVGVKLLSETKGNGEDFMNEVASIGRTSHVNIVTLMGFCSEGSKRALVYEYMPNGSLEKFIYADSKVPKSRHLGWEKLYQISVGIARGLEYLHRGCTTRILHFDIKPHNILLDKDFCPKISDFGMAKLCPTRDSIISMVGTRGTAGYIAPEVFSRNFGGVSYKSDVYSYGMMVLEMVGGRRNIDAECDNTSEIYFPHWIYKRLNYVSLELLFDQEFASDEELIKVRKMILVGIWCIQTNSANRPSMSRVVEMLEGSLEAIQVPPKPYLSSPPRSPDQQASSTISTQQLSAEV